MVKKENKDLAKKVKSNKTSKKDPEDSETTMAPPARTNQIKTGKAKKKHQVKDSDDEYELPNPAFECPDENVEQALSASFIEVYEKKEQSEVVGDSQKLTDKPTKKQVAAEESQKKFKSKEKSANVVVKEKKAAKRKQIKENDDVGAKKVKETSESTGKKRKQNETVEARETATEGCRTRLQKKLGNIKVEVGTIKMEPGTVNNAGDAKKQQRGIKKRKVSTEEAEEECRTNKLGADDDRSQTEGQIRLSIGSLPSGCNKEALNFFFNECDLYPQINCKKKLVTIESEKGVKRHRNIVSSATVICTSQAEADTILKLNGSTMTSVTGEESEITISLKESSDPIESATKLYIGSLHPKIPEAELLEAFEDEGINLIQVKRACWKGGKRPKGFGFVWLPTPEDVTKALAANITLEGKQLVIMHCKP